MAAAPALVDIGLLLLILLALLLLATLTLIGNNAPSFPFGIGNVVKDYVTDPLSNLLRYLIHVLLESLIDFTTAAVWDTAAGLAIGGHGFTQVVGYFFDTIVQIDQHIFGPAIIAFMNFGYGGNIVGDIQYGVQVASSAAAQAAYLGGISRDLAQRVVGLEQTVFSLAQQVNQVSLSQVLHAAAIAVQAEQDAQLALARIDDIGKTVLYPLAATVNTLRTDVDLNKLATSVLTQEVGPIITAFPLLQQNIGSIITDIPLIGGAVKALEGEVELVLPLAAITALGAVAIDTLVNVAEDPCFCFNLGGDLEWMKIAVVDQMMLNGV